MSILQLLGLTPVKPFTSSKAVPLPCADPALLMGLELEIEGIPVDPSELYVSGMGGEADNSLRDNEYGRGWEFITRPATFSVAAHTLSQFFAKAKLSQERNYSERCSIHVHANVQDLTPEQLKSVCLLYQVFERLFYSYAGEDRDKNIFCVPWSETTLTHTLIDTLLDANLKGFRNWQKYTGLNLIPVQTQGTIEFRHLPGTCDLSRIFDWMNLIGSLFVTARNTPFEEIKSFIVNVNTTSEYKHLVHRVFGEWARVLDMPYMDTQLEEGVLDVKYMLLSADKPKVPTKLRFNDWAALAPAQRARVQVEEPVEVAGNGNIIDDDDRRDDADVLHQRIRDAQAQEAIRAHGQAVHNANLLAARRNPVAVPPAPRRR